MGLAKNQKHEAKPSSGGRGSVNNGNRLDAFAAGADRAEADWGGCSPEKLHGVIVQITAMGGAIILGLSRDLGSHSLTLLLNGEKQSLYYNGAADLDAAMDEVAAKLESMV